MSKTPFLAAAWIGMVSSVHFFAEASAERKAAAIQYFILMVVDWTREREESMRGRRREPYLLYISLLGCMGRIQLHYEDQP